MEPQKFIEFNRLLINIGSKIILRRVLFVNSLGSIKLGQPYLSNTVVKGTISKHFLGPKILVFKMKPKKKYRKKFGHRQKLTRLFINQIE